MKRPFEIALHAARRATEDAGVHASGGSRERAWCVLCSSLCS
jgi:hypothetical protein